MAATDQGVVVLLDLFDGPGRQQVIDLLAGSRALRRVELRQHEPIESLLWHPTGPTLQLLDAPMDRASVTGADADAIIVVTRDPRDLSVLFARSRHALTSGRSSTEQLLAGMAALKDQERMFRSWAPGERTDVEFVTSYEAIAADPDGFLSAVAEFVGIAVSPPASLFGDRPVATPFDTGGTIGVWRRSFDGEAARLFEQLFPGLVADLALDSPDWAETIEGAVDNRRVNGPLLFDADARHQPDRVDTISS